jgi:hypothetical protein
MEGRLCRIIILLSFVTMADSLYQCYHRTCPPSKVYLVYMTYQELTIRPSSDEWMSLY